MTSLLQMQIFFFISSIGFIIVAALVIILLVKVISISNTFHKMVKKVEHDIDTLGDTTKEMIEDIRDSVFFNFLFKGRSKKKSSVARGKKD